MFDRACGFAAIALIVAAVIWVLLLDHTALQDFPEWEYQAYLMYDRLAGAAPVNTVELVNHPVPNAFSQLVMAGLMTVVTPLWAGRLLVVAYLLGFGLLLWHMSRRVDPRRPGILMAVVTSSVLLSSGFWNGYLNFQFSLFFLALYVYIRFLAGRSHHVWTAVCSLAIFCCHPTTLLVLVFLVVVTAFFDRERFWADFVALLPATALTVWYLVSSQVLKTEAGPEAGGISGWFLYKAYTVAKLGPFHGFIMADGRALLEELPSIYYLGVVANLVFAAAIIVLLFVDVSQAIQQRRLHAGTPCAWSIGPPVVLFVALPPVLFGLVNPGERFLVASSLLLLLLRPPVESVWRARALNVAALTFLVTVLNVFAFLAVSAAFPPGDVSIADGALPGAAGDLRGHIDTLYDRTRLRYFNHRPYQFLQTSRWLRDRDSAPPPPLVFDSGLLTAAD